MWRYISDAGIILISHFISAIGTFGIQIFLTQTLTLNEYGQYSILQATVSLIEGIFLARSGEVAMFVLGRAWATESGDFSILRRSLVGNDLRINLFIYLMVVIIGWLFGSVINLRFDLLVVLALTVPAQVGYGVSKSVFVLGGHLKKQAQFEVAMLLFYSLLAVMLSVYFGINGLIVAIVIERITKTVVARKMTDGLWPELKKVKIKSNYDSELLTQVRSGNVHAVIRNALMNAASQGDILLISILRGQEAAGLYKVGKSIAAIPIKAINPLWYALRPRIVSFIRAKMFRELRSTLNRASLAVFLLGILIAWPIFYRGEWLVGYLFGMRYVSAFEISLWLMIGTWVSGASLGWLSFACVMSRQKVLGSVINLIWFLGTLIGGFMFGSQSNVHMAIVTSASMVLSSLVGWWVFMRDSVWSD
jgi:O-antigen/teichoic acid export membrane protein